MGRSTIKKVRQSAAAAKRRLQIKLDNMEAAYRKETDIPANEAKLVYHVYESDEGIKTDFWFEHHTERAKLAEVHPDIEYLFALTAEITHARKNGGDVEKGLKLLDEFTDKYQKAIDEDAEKMKKLEEKSKAEKTDDT